MDRTKNHHYFRCLLRDHLRESFPQLAEDVKLINQRAKWALSAYEGALSAQNSESQSLEIAKYILFEGFHFSKFDTVLEVVCFEFTDLLPAGKRRAFALKVMPLCEAVFARYELSDDFAYNIAYDLLYRELKEVIQNRIKDYGVQ